jgi:hypothetical protein
LNVCRFVFRGRVHFYGEPAAAPDETSGRASWLERKWDSWHARLINAEGHTGRLLRTLEAWLKRFEAPDEPMLRALRHADTVTLVRGEDVDPDSSRREWHGYLRGRLWRHGPWLVFNLAVTPFAALLTPLPGPNIMAYWFVYRAICDALAVAGARHAAKRSLPLQHRASAALDDWPATDATIDQLAAEMNWTGFRTFLDRLGAHAPTKA